MAHFLWENNRKVIGHGGVRVAPPDPLGRAVASALEDAEVGAPGADGFAVLVGQNSGDLVEVSQVMSGPGGEKLGESDYTEGRVAAGAREVLLAEIQGTKFSQVFRAQGSKYVE
jgi:hypothetical protein